MAVTVHRVSSEVYTGVSLKYTRREPVSGVPVNILFNARDGRTGGRPGVGVGGGGEGGEALEEFIWLSGFYTRRRWDLQVGLGMECVPVKR